MWSGADGASAERTRLSWRRTTLSCTAVLLLTIRLATRDRFTALGAVMAALALIAWLAHLWLTQRRIDAMAERRPAGVGRALPAMAVTAVAFALFGVALALTAR
jgi:small-conductance mechanosensitive channel